MLTIFEKIQYGFCGLVLFIVLLKYVVWGTPEIRSVDVLPAMKTLAPKPAAAVEPGKGNAPAPSAEELVERRNLEKNLVEQGVSPAAAKNVEKVAYEVPRETYDYIKKKDNWIPELQKAASNVIQAKDGKNSILEFSAIEGGSLFEKVGFKQGDRLHLINGQQLIFDESKSYEYMKLADQWMEDLKNGKKLSITLLRGGKPVNLEFKL